jgi:hypothetical protein
MALLRHCNDSQSLTLCCPELSPLWLVSLPFYHTLVPAHHCTPLPQSHITRRSMVNSTSAHWVIGLSVADACAGRSQALNLQIFACCLFFAGSRNEAAVAPDKRLCTMQRSKQRCNWRRKSCWICAMQKQHH